MRQSGRLKDVLLLYFKSPLEDTVDLNGTGASNQNAAEFPSYFGSLQKQMVGWVCMNSHATHYGLHVISETLLL